MRDGAGHLNGQAARACKLQGVLILYRYPLGAYSSPARSLISQGLGLNIHERLTSRDRDALSQLRYSRSAHRGVYERADRGRQTSTLPSPSPEQACRWYPQVGTKRLVEFSIFLNLLGLALLFGPSPRARQQNPLADPVNHFADATRPRKGETVQVRFFLARCLGPKAPRRFAQ